MGNILGERTTLEKLQTEQVYQRKIACHQFDLWTILISRAISEHSRRIYMNGISNGQFQLLSTLVYRAMSERICRELVHGRGIVNDQFQLCRVLYCTNMLDYIIHKSAYKKRISDSQFQVWSVLIFGPMIDYIQKTICKKSISNDQPQPQSIMIYKAISGYIFQKPKYRNEISTDQFVNLPEDVLCTILSKLPLDDVVRTSVLSSNWRCLWTACLKLNFDGNKMFGKKIRGSQKKQYTQEFIDIVNTVLQQCHGRVVEEFAIKVEFEIMLVDHLNSWVKFAVSSHTKFLAFDLRWLDFDDPCYIFPFHLLDNKTIRRLQHIQLAFLSVQLPTMFSGFPNLRKLDLCRVRVSAKDLQDMLSNCCNLEWLNIVLCYLHGELKVDSPLNRLLYLNVDYCEVTKMELHAVKLRTSVYEGTPVPIHLDKFSELEKAKILFNRGTIVTAIPLLSDVLSNVQNLALKIFVIPSPKAPCFIEISYKFSRLKHLQLSLFCTRDVDNLSLVTFLGAVPFIEKLEIHARIPVRRFEHPYHHLKDVCMTGFKASNGQLEFLIHIVENSPALEALTIDQLDPVEEGNSPGATEKQASFMEDVYGLLRNYIEGEVSHKCSVRLI